MGINCGSVDKCDLHRIKCIEKGDTPECMSESSTGNYRHQGAIGLFKERAGWLFVFFLGLLGASFVVESFAEVLEKHVQLSFFVPLVMGHGGNTGSQAASTVLRALALKQISTRDAVKTVLKEAAAGFLTGLLLGCTVLFCSLFSIGLSPAVGLVVAIALPVVSLWSNGLGALLTIWADYYRLDPAVTSAPLMTTIVDCTGLIVYFYIAIAIMAVGENGPVAALHGWAMPPMF